MLYFQQQGCGSGLLKLNSTHKFCGRTGYPLLLHKIKEIDQQETIKHLYDRYVTKELSRSSYIVAKFISSIFGTEYFYASIKFMRQGVGLLPPLDGSTNYVMVPLNGEPQLGTLNKKWQPNDISRQSRFQP